MTPTASLMRLAHHARALRLARLAAAGFGGFRSFGRSLCHFAGLCFVLVVVVLSVVPATTPAYASGTNVSVTVEHDGPLVLGDFEQVPLRISADENAATAGRPIRASVNVGQISDVERIGEGQYRAIFTPPKAHHPQVALIAVWRETGPDAEVRFVRIPLFGRTALPVKTSKHAHVRVVVGDAVFGPVDADAKGRATVPVVVPPGLDEVVAISEDSTGESQATVKTGVPPYNRLTLAVTPYLVRADGTSSATVIAYYDRSAPPPMRWVRIKADGGKVSPVSQTEGRYHFRYTPGRNIEKKQVTLRASVRQDPAARAEAHLSIGVPLPEAILLYVGDTKLVTGRGDGVTLSAFVVDRFGLNVPGVTITATSSDAQITSTEASPEGEIFVHVSDPNAYPPGGQATLSLRLQRDDGKMLEERVAIEVDPPRWPSSARFDVAAESLHADPGAPILVDFHVAKANGDAFVGDDLVLRSEDAVVTPIVAVDGEQGHFRTTVQPHADRDAVKLLLTDSTGHLRVEHELRLRASLPTLTIGPRIGVAFHPEIAPEIGIEIDIQTRIHRMLAGGYARASYRRMQNDLPATTVLSQDFRVKSTLALLPISVGGRLAVALDADFAFQAYVGAGLSLDLYRSELEHVLTNIRADVERQSGRALGWEAFGGLELYRGYVEIKAHHMAISTETLSAPTWSILGLLGYRIGVL
ncbi:MAG: hypothetical protein H6729_12980 [Deltaproteobacteria bacterium]|nr:hypothetical protein [Deltaproteobacteria bacterium]